ncbi:MAG: TolB-like 6-bladed beta-propeller domain-containing protein [Bacteroidales bacterium]|nr:TolB-like 6-bladed beta-propeller domain-containing protein [Bacteroidales bacterium]
MDFPVYTDGRIVDSSGTLNTRLPASFDIVQSGYLIVNPFSKNEVITILNPDSLSIITKAGSLGHGPNEFVQPTPTQFSKLKKMLSISDFGRQEIKEYKVLDGNISLHKSWSLKDFGGSNCYDIFRISTNLIITQNIENEISKLSLRDTLGNIIQEITLMPVYNYAKYNKANFHFHYVESHNLLICGLSEAGYISCYELINEELILKWQKWIESPVYSVIDGVIHWDRAYNQQGFWEVKSSDDYIYALYKGYSENQAIENKIHGPGTILKFDFNGNPLNRIELNRTTIRFAVPDDREIIGIAADTVFKIIHVDISQNLSR